MPYTCGALKRSASQPIEQPFIHSIKLIPKDLIFISSLSLLQQKMMAKQILTESSKSIDFDSVFVLMVNLGGFLNLNADFNVFFDFSGADAIFVPLILLLSERQNASHVHIQTEIQNVLFTTAVFLIVNSKKKETNLIH